LLLSGKAVEFVHEASHLIGGQGFHLFLVWEVAPLNMILAAMPTTAATPRITNTSFTRIRQQVPHPVKFKNRHHSFWYEEAEKEFLDIAKDDPHCAIAHWGVAMSLWHQLWNEPEVKMIARGLSEIKTAQKLSRNATAREKAYIAAVKAFYSDSKKRNHDARAKAYSVAMKKVYESYPDDHEAATFYALSLLASEPHNDETFASRKEAAAILEKLFEIEPDHPGVAHYLIHSYDTAQLAHPKRSNSKTVWRS
jgi:hypothetical protein